MDYKEARVNIKSGDLLAWTHKKWNSWYDLQIQAVRMFTRSEYCHVGIAWCVGGRVFILESVGTGVRIFPLSRELPFYWLPARWAWNDTAEEFALAEVGKPYSKIRAILASFGKITKGEGKQWECAEFAWSVIVHCGKSFDCLATPTALVEAVQEFGSPTYLISQ